MFLIILYYMFNNLVGLFKNLMNHMIKTMIINGSFEFLPNSWKFMKIITFNSALNNFQGNSLDS